MRHTSKLIRSIGHDRLFSMTGGIDIFVDCFLRGLSGFSSHDLGRHQLDLQDDDDAEEAGSE